MRRKAGTDRPMADRVVKDSRRKTRKHHSEEQKIRILLDGLRGGENGTLSAIGRSTMAECGAVPTWGDCHEPVPLRV